MKITCCDCPKYQWEGCENRLNLLKKRKGYCRRWAVSHDENGEGIFRTAEDIERSEVR